MPRSGKGNVVRFPTRRDRIAERLMHPLELESDVVVESAVMKRHFDLEWLHGPTIPEVIRRCVVHIEGWRYCPEKGEHEYTGVIPVVHSSALFTDAERAAGVKELTFWQHEVVTQV